MAVYKRDIVDINLETGNIHRSFLKHSIGYLDQKADHFGVRVFRDGEPVNLTGVSVQGVFMPPQGSPIAITSGNIVSENVAEVVLPQACYNYDGQFTLAIKLVDSTNSVTGTVRIVDGMVDNTHASGTVAPTSAVPTYQEVLSTYEQAIAAINKTVRFDATQSLTDIQKATARTNIGAVSTAEMNTALAQKVNVSDIENDLTGTTAGKVLDARQGKVLDDKVSDVKSAFDDIGTAETWSWEFDRLQYTDNSGTTAPSTRHLLSHQIYHVAAGDSVTIDAGFACTPAIYYSDGTFKQFGTKRTGPYTISFNSANYIRLYVVTDPNGNIIAPSDINDKIHASFYLGKYYAKNATKEQLDGEIEAVDTKFGKIAKGVSARGQASFNIDTVNKNVEMPSDRLYFDGHYYQASATTLAYGSLGYPAVFYNTSTHAYEIHALDSSLTENTISEHCRFIAYINKSNPWQSSSALKYTVDGKQQYADLVVYPDTGKNAIFENWSYPKSYRHPGVVDKLFVGIVQMNNGKQGVIEYDVQTHNISRYIFNDFSALDSHNAMAVSVMPNRHILVCGTGHTTSSNIVSYISKKQEDISEFNARVLIPLPTPENGMNRGTYCQLFYLDGKYHLFTRMTYTPSDYSYYIDTWGHATGTITTDDDGNESISWSAFKPFVTTNTQGLKYYAKGAYYTGTKLKFFCQSNYSAGQSDIRLCYLDVSTGAITDDAGNTLGNENTSPVAYSDIPVVIAKGTAKLHLNDVLDGATNAITYSKIDGSYTGGQRAFFAIYENSAWNNIELAEQGTPVYGSGSSGPGVTIIDENTIAMAKNNSTHWTIEQYERNGNSFDFVKTLLDSYSDIALFQPFVSVNVHKSIVCARGYATDYYDMDISTAIIDLS